MRGRAISAGALIALALAFLILPLRWLLAGILAAAFHEFCHWAAIRLCGGEVTGFRFAGGGAVMTAGELGRAKELICVLAGPAGSLLLLFAAKWLPAVAVCALLQAAYNLLPIYPLDGGRALRCAARLCLSPAMAQRITLWTERFCLAAIVIGAVYGAMVLKLGLMPLLLAVILLFKKNSLQTAENKSTIGLPFLK